jgi:serine/threonine protein kinase
MPIGRVAVLAELGAGAGSRVFRVRREADSQEYALKIVPIRCRNDLKYLEQAKHEFRVGRMLDHANLVKVHVLETERGWFFSGPKKGKLLIEYIPGKPLNEHAPRCMAELLRIFERVADAIAHMHDRGVIHADLKPKNLIYAAETGVKVIDFGLAWVKGEPKNRLQGTPQYMAPETSAHKLINERTDIYNFGATMYRLVALRTLPKMLPGLVPDEKTHAKRIKPVESLNPATPAELSELIHWCIRYNPDSRPSQMREVHSILSRLANERKARD